MMAGLRADATDFTGSLIGKVGFLPLLFDSSPISP
jgi:hypothetical protein